MAAQDISQYGAEEGASGDVSFADAFEEEGEVVAE